jgi:hypothetical protein
MQIVVYKLSAQLRLTVLGKFFVEIVDPAKKDLFGFFTRP